MRKSRYLIKNTHLVVVKFKNRR